MATPLSFVGKGTTGTAKAVAKKAQPSPWEPVLSFGQTLIDTISTPLYYVQGAVSGIQQGKNPLETAAENATAWTKGVRPKTGSDLLKEAGMSNDFWSSLAADIAMDPLTYTPGVVISAPIKAALAGVKWGVKGAGAAAKGAVSPVAASITRTATKGAAAPLLTTPEKFTRVGKLTSQQALERTTAAAEKSKQFIYQPVAVESQSVSQALANMIGSGLDAAYKGSRMSIEKSLYGEAIRKINKKTARAIRKGEQVALPKIADEVLPETAAPSAPVDLAPAEVVTESANVARVENIPVVDSSRKVTPMEMTAIQKTVAPQTAKGIQSRLNKVDKLVQGIKAVSANTDDVAAKVLNQLSKGRQAGYKFTATEVAADETILRNLDLAIKGQDYDPIAFFRDLSTSTNSVRRNLYSLLRNTRVTTQGGKVVSVDDIVSNKAFDGLYGNLDEEGRIALLNLLDEVKSIATKGDKAIFDKNLKAIKALLPEDVVGKVIATGAADPAKATDYKALEAILSELPKGVEKSYKVFDDLVSGIKAGDVIDNADLLKVMKLLDPESETITAVGKALKSAESTDVLKSLLVTKGANTVQTMRNNLRLMDTDAFWESTNMAFKDTAFITQAGVLKGIQDTDVTAAMQSREAAGLDLVRFREEGLGTMIDDASDSIGRGMKAQIGAIYKTDQAGVSRLGENYTRAYREDGSTEGYLYNIFSQYVETKVLGSVLGKMSYRANSKAAKRAEQELAPLPTNVDAVMREFVTRTSLVEKLVLNVFGARVTHVTSSMKVKGKVEEAFHHYVTVGDIVDVMSKTNRESTARLLFPTRALPKAGFDAASDSISFQTVGDVVSDILKSMDRNKPFDAEAAIKALSTPAKGKTWSAEFQKLVSENVQDFVDGLLKNSETFADTHKAKLKAEVIDSIRPAQKFSMAMVDTFMEAYDAMKAAGRGTIIERQRLVHDWMLKFAAVSDIFSFSNGQVAAEAFRSTARVFLELGNLNNTGTIATEWRKKLTDLATLNPAASDAYKEFMDTWNNYYKWVPTVETQTGAGKATVDAAQKAYVVAKDDFEKSVKSLTTNMTQDEVAAWRKSHDAIQNALIESRKLMGKAGLEAEYWNGQTWVPQDRFSRAAAIKSLEKMPNRYIYTKSGIIDVVNYMVDKQATIPSFKKYGKKHTAETRKMFEEMAATRRSEVARNDKANAQETILGDMAEFENMTPDNPGAVVERMNEELFVRRFDEGTPKVEIETPPTGAKQADEVTDIPTYWVATNMRTALTEEGVTRGRLLGQKLQGGAGYRELLSLFARAESTAHNAVADVSDVMKSAMQLFRKANLRPEDMDTALAAAMSKTVANNASEDVVTELSRQLEKTIDALVTHVKTRGLHPKYIREAFRRQRIDKFIMDWDAFTKPEDIDLIISRLPIGGAPADLLQGIESADEVTRQISFSKLDAWQQAQKEWAADVTKREDSAASIGLFYRAVAAIQNASSEATLAGMLIEDFNFMQYYPGLSKEAARKAALASGDFVQVRPKGQGSSLVRWFADEDNLFHKDIAPQLGALERNYNYTMENNMGKFLRNSMNILSIFKATQTILRPGHLVNTAIGDSIVSLMRGTNPLHFRKATDIAMRFAGTKIAADWKISESGKRMELLQQSLAGLTKREIDEANEVGFSVAINGKKTNLSNEDLELILRDSGALLSNVTATDEMMQYQELQAFRSGTDQGVEYNKMVLGKLQAKAVGAGAQRAWLTAIKPAGDAVAYVGNIPRVATALDVLKKGNFKSLEDASKAVADELVLYHPTILSLSAFERQKIRPWFSYYTWLRGAHVAFLKMATEHTAAMLIPSKIFYNQALANEMEPGSIGNLWGNKNTSPRYLDYSVYGPTTQGPRGGIVYRPGILPLDVLDTWNLQYDSTKSLDKQAFDNLASVGQGVFGKNMNLVLQPGIEFLTGTDPSTGRPSTIKDLGTAGDALFGNIGQMQLLQGLGLYTPSNKGPESTNPLTDRDRELKLLNYMLGQRVMDVETPANIRNASTDLSARLKRLAEQQAQE